MHYLFYWELEKVIVKSKVEYKAYSTKPNVFLKHTNVSPAVLTLLWDNTGRVGGSRDREEGREERRLEGLLFPQLSSGLLWAVAFRSGP